MTLPRKPLREQVRQHLLDAIASGRLSAGQRVIEARVAEDLGVSPIPIREAVRELVAIGILEAAPHRGAWVRQVSLQETIEAFEIRAALEPLAAPAAAPALCGKAGPLRKVVASLVAAAARRDFAAYQRHNQKFHRTIVQSAGNRVLLRVWDSLAFEVRTRFVMDYLTSIDPEHVAREHEAIVDALDRGDGRLAAALLASHSAELVGYLRGRE